MKLQGCLSSLEKLGKAYFFHFELEQLEKRILLIKMLVGKAGNFFPVVYIFYIQLN